MCAASPTFAAKGPLRSVGPRVIVPHAGLLQMRLARNINNWQVAAEKLGGGGMSNFERASYTPGLVADQEKPNTLPSSAPDFFVVASQHLRSHSTERPTGR